jgi:hypothetical protein
MRPAALLGLLACATALGALAVGRLVVLPEIGTQTPLVDANLAKTLCGPIHARLAEVILAAHLVLAAIAGRWFGARWPTTIALLLVGTSAVHRFVVLPSLYAAWSRADLVAGRPIDELVAADRLELQELALTGVMVVLHTIMLTMASRRFAPAKAAPDPAPTAPPGQLERGVGPEGQLERGVGPEGQLETTPA